MDKTNITFTTREEMFEIKLERIDAKLEEVKTSIFICCCFTIGFVGLTAISIIKVLLGSE